MAIIVSLRKAIKGPVGKILMGGIFITMFGGFGLSRIFLKFFKGSSFEGVALVNGIDISRQSFQAAVAQEDQRISAIRQQYGEHADLYMNIMGMNTDPQVNALNALIHGAVMEDFAEKLQLHLSHGYLEARLADPRFLMNEFGHLLPRETFLKDGGIDTYAVLEFLKQTGQMEAIEEQLREKLIKQFAILMLQSGFFVPSFMIKQMYVEQKLGKKFSYQTFTLATFIQKERTAGATDEQLKAFYDEQNKLSRRYWIPELRSGNKWTFSADQYGITIDASDVDAYYAKNKATRFVKEPVQIQVREIVFGDLVKRGRATVQEEAEKVYAELMQNPADFEKLAKANSTDKESGAKGGLVEWFKRGAKDKAYEKGAFKLKEDGEISPLVETKDALVILQRVARKEATFEPLEKVRADIVKILTDQKFRTEFTRQANQLSRQDDTQNALKGFVQLHKGVESSLNEVKKDTADIVSQRLFVLKNDGDLSVFVQDGKGVIVQFAGKTPSKAAVIEKVFNEVASDYYEAKATKALEAAVKKAKEQTLAQKKLVSVDGGKISSTEWIKADDTKMLEKLVEQGFPQGFMELDWEGAVLSNFNKDGGVVLRLDETEEFKEEALEEQKQGMLKQVFERNSGLFSQAFIASLFRNATIKVNDELSRVKDQL